MNTPKKKLDFAKPPIDEVVLSVLFAPLDKLLAPHLGEIWQKFKQEGFVHLSEHPPVPPAVERFPNPLQEAQFQIRTTPELARIWFIGEDNREIVQIQRDRFTFNWRKTEEDQSYPGFSIIFKKFENFYNRFRQETEALQIGPIMPLQYELTYIDQVFQGDGWHTLDDMWQIYTIIVDPQRSDAFWSEAEYVSWRTAFPLVDLHGRLYMSISNRIKMPDERHTLQTDFTVRGFPENAETSMATWFKAARNRIREKFSSIFTEDIQTRVWERKE